MKTKKIQSILFLGILIVISIVFFAYWGNQKQVWFCDEVYSYESANGFEQQWPEKTANTWMTGADVEKFFSADWDNLCFNEISSKLYNDHVPLYFWLFRIVSFFFFKGSGTIWIGLTLNLLFYLIVLVAGYKMFLRLTGSPAVSAVTMLVTSVVNRLMLQQILTLRMYIMLLWAQMFLILGGLWILKELDKKKMSPGVFIYLYIVSLAGFLTHYDYWIFYATTAAIFCMWLLILAFKQKGIKGFWKTTAFRYVLAWVGNFAVTLGTTILVFPYCRWNLNKGKGQTALQSVFDFSAIKLKQLAWGFERLSAAIFGEKFPYILGLIIIFGLLVSGAVILYKKEEKKKMTGLILTVLACIGYQMIVCFTMPAVWEERYLWGGFSIMLWCTAYSTILLIQALVSKIKAGKMRSIGEKALYIVLSISILIGQFVIIDGGKGIAYLFGQEKDVTLLEDNSTIPWIVYGPTGGVYSHYDWLMPEEICFMTEDESKEAATAVKKLENEEKFILYCFEAYAPMVEAFFEKELGKELTYEHLTDSTFLKVYLFEISE